METNGVIIKGNKDGLNALVDIKKFGGFEEMLLVLTEKLLRGKKFYKNSILYITIDTSLLNENEMEKLKKVILDEIEVKEIIIESIQDKAKKATKNKSIEQEATGEAFDGVQEGKTKFLRKTVRGGQCVHFPGNIVIIGDINSGAEVYADGNIIVLGSIKGNVFAGNAGDSNAVIAAFSLQPEILKIGDIITISPDNQKPRYPEVARIKDGEVIVEPYLTNKYIY
ncbi:MAG: septum site-determining protein MinC [Clostridium sp.]|uniref:septum site-determining protein MinC n=1 Tax=Clostridium sp. DSM 8431 TaxID=1761781 RepID=UPI0008E467DA|nr:septum site-determining protein MinC [Clostridium sp. DSM 8431]MCR4943714.1 septum site-determining protein MinC [Clostridium sp.]SFU82632.1 septum site-determining protein MinC [Clostridium sp. DSM 8431]